MGNRLSRIYTRTGDDGSTGLGDGTRVPKTHGRIEAYGAVDEANSAIGMTLAVPGLPKDLVDLLITVQHELFDLGGELAVPGHRAVTQHQIDALGMKRQQPFENGVARRRIGTHPPAAATRGAMS